VSAAGAGLSLLALFAAVAAAVAWAARWLERRIPTGLLWLFALISLLFVAPGLLGRAPFGPDQAFLTLPPAGSATRSSVWSNDVARQVVPWQEAVSLAWKEGSLPHRDRWNGCGTPLAANGQSGAYSPLTLIGLLLPASGVLSLWGALRLFLCLTGMWLWLTELSVSSRAALFGAIAFSLSMTMTAWLFFAHTAVICLWPWVLFLIERLAGGARRRRAAAALTGCLLLWPLAGHLESAASGAAFTGLWLALRAFLGDRERVVRMLLPLSAAAALALGLSAFSLLPQALAIGASNRLVLVEQPFWTPILSLEPHGPAWRFGALAVFFPRLFGDRIQAAMIPGGPGAFPEIALGYFGILPIACLPLLWRPGSARPAPERALLGPLLFGLGAPIGLWPFAEIASALPGLGHMFPLRFFSWFALAGAGLAAFELDRLEKDLAVRRGARVWPLASIAAVLLLALLTYRGFRAAYVAAGSLPAERRAFLLAAATLVAALPVMAMTVASPKRFRAWGLPVLSLIAGLELGRQGARLYGWAGARNLYAATPLVRFLRAKPPPFRIVGGGAELFPNVNVFPRIEEIRTHDPAERRDYVEFLDATSGYDPRDYFKQIADVNAPALDFLNVRYLVAGPGSQAPSAKWSPVYGGSDGTVFENAHVLPRVFAPERVRVVRRAPSRWLLEPANRAYGETYRELLRGLDWAREAVVLDEGTEGFSAAEVSRASGVEIDDYREATNEISFRVRVADGPGRATLVASVVQDGGWRARDESGGAISTGRANGPFLALSVPRGDRRILLEYAPPGFRLGAWISAFCLAVAAVTVFALRGHVGEVRRERSPR